MAAIESIIEHIAATVGLDAMEVKLKNTNASLYPKIPEFWTTMQSWGEIAERKKICENFNKVLINKKCLAR